MRQHALLIQDRVHHDDPSEKSGLYGQGRLKNPMAEAAHDFNDYVTLDRGGRVQVFDNVVEACLVQMTGLRDEINQLSEVIWQDALLETGRVQCLNGRLYVGPAAFSG